MTCSLIQQISAVGKAPARCYAGYKDTYDTTLSFINLESTLKFDQCQHRDISHAIMVERTISVTNTPGNLGQTLRRNQQMSIIVSWRELLLSAIQKRQLFAAAIILQISVASKDWRQAGRGSPPTPFLPGRKRYLLGGSQWAPGALPQVPFCGVRCLPCQDLTCNLCKAGGNFLVFLENPT